MDPAGALYLLLIELDLSVWLKTSRLSSPPPAGVTETSCPLAQKLPRRGEWCCCFISKSGIYIDVVRDTRHPDGRAFPKERKKKPSTKTRLVTFADRPCSPPFPPLLFFIWNRIFSRRCSSPSAVSLALLAAISFPLFPLSLLLCALLLIFCPTHEVLLPEGVFKLHPAKKKKKGKKRHHKTPALASRYSPNAISSDFVCMIQRG